MLVVRVVILVLFLTLGEMLFIFTIEGNVAVSLAYMAFIMLKYANKDPSSQGYGFSSSQVWMWELEYKEGWVQ